MIRYAPELLTPREVRILELRFGLNGNKPHTLQRAGGEVGVSRERVRQIEMKAFRKLGLLLMVDITKTTKALPADYILDAPP